MTERERLVELLREAENKYLNLLEFEKSILARYLLENGVVVLRCKVGDTVYRIDDKQVFDWWEVEHIEIYADETVYIDDSDNTFTDDDIGKTVFLTKEEAEQALAERNVKDA